MSTIDTAADVATEGPLSGVKVLDLSSTFMGPYCTLLLAQAGADVIKVEPGSGDINRYINDPDGIGLGSIFLNANQGKRSISLDLGATNDYELFSDLVRDADVVVNNRTTSSARRLKADGETLLRINPKVIYCTMHGFGSDGPYGEKSAYDDVIQAISGFAACQSGDGELQYVRTPVADKLTGQLAFGAICAALYERNASGRGQLVEVPMFEAAVQFLLLEQQGGYVYNPPRGKHGYARLDSPHRKPFRTADGSVGIVAHTDKHWTELFAAFERPDMALDPRFSTITKRTEHIDELYGWLQSVIAGLTTERAAALLSQVGVPYAPVNTVPDLFLDEHLLATGMFQDLDHPDVGHIRQARFPVNYSRTQASRTLRPAPRLDAHGEEIRTRRQF